MYLLSLLLFMILSIFFLLQSINGNPAYYIDPPSLLFMLLFTIPVLISAGLFRDFNNAFRLSARRNADCSRRELERAIEAVSLAAKTLWSAGIFSSIFALVFSFLSYEHSAELLLPYIGVSVLPLLYASFFVILLLPMQSRLKLRLGELSDQPGISLPKSGLSENSLPEAKLLGTSLPETDLSGTSLSEADLSENKTK